MQTLDLPDPPARERRSAYTDAWLSALTAAASEGVDSSVLRHVAVEVAASAWARAFLLADVQPEAARRALPPALMGLIARQLCRAGQFIAAIDIAGGQRVVLPAADAAITGGPAESTWKYVLSLPGPSSQRNVTLPSAGVVHVRYAVDPLAPWIGVSPWAASNTSSKMAGVAEQRLRDETGAAVGNVLPVPQEGGDGGEDDPLAQLKSDLGKLAGNLALVETEAAGFGDGRQAAPQTDWRPRRIGADPPDSLIQLRLQNLHALLAAAGVPPIFLGLGQSSASGLREAWRGFAHGTLTPIGELVAAELRDKLGIPDLRIGFTRLYAGDTQGRGRALKSLVDAGVPLQEARTLTGLD